MSEVKVWWVHTYALCGKPEKEKEEEYRFVQFLQQIIKIRNISSSTKVDLKGSKVPITWEGRTSFNSPSIIRTGDLFIFRMYMTYGN